MLCAREGIVSVERLKSCGVANERVGAVEGCDATAAATLKELSEVIEPTDQRQNYQRVTCSFATSRLNGEKCAVSCDVLCEGVCLFGFCVSKSTIPCFCFQYEYHNKWANSSLTMTEQNAAWISMEYSYLQFLLIL